MLHPRLTPIGGTIGGTSSMWLPLYQVGPYGAWGDLQLTARWGDGSVGMYEAQWTMPLPADFDHPLLRRGTAVELMAGPWRTGQPLILAEPNRGTGSGEPWQFTATGIGRDVEGTNSFYAFDGSDNATAVPTTAVDKAITDGWRIAGRDASVTSTQVGDGTTTIDLNTVGSLLSAAAQVAGKRWGVKNDNRLYFMSDPTTPTYQVIPGASALGVADDDYASTVKVRYRDSSTGQFLTRTATNAQTAATFGVRQFPVDITDRGAMSSAAAQNIADQILALAKGRMGWTNGLTVTSNELLTMGGVAADLSKVLEDVANGCMIRLHGIFNDLLAFNGQTWIDIIIGEAKYTDGAQTIDLNPIGLAPRDLAAIVESVAGPAAA